MAIQWSKSPGDVWNGAIGPFIIHVKPQGDGRWDWKVFDGPAVNPMASGLARTLGAAKAVVLQFVNRTGRV